MSYEREHIVRREPVHHVTEAEHVDAVTVDPVTSRNARIWKFQEAIYVLFGVIEVLIAIRFVLRAFGANPNAPFSSAIYTITGPFIAPFVGVFGPIQFSGSVIEPHSILAILAYALLAWLLAKLVWLAMASTRAEVASHTHVVRSDSRVADDVEHEEVRRVA